MCFDVAILRIDSRFQPLPGYRLILKSLYREKITIWKISREVRAFNGDLARQ